MRHLTPHQFAPLSEFLDTLVVRSFTPLPLDVAVPHSASSLISEQLAAHVVSRFVGRATYLDAGAGPVGDVVDLVENLQSLWPHPIRFALWITDRTLLQDVWLRHGHVTVLCLDWWRWIVSRVPANRLADAWMYLALACPEYWASPERKQLGIHEPTASAMAHEGRKILAEVQEFAAQELAGLWGSQHPSLTYESSER